MHHGTARLRQEIETETALRHAALAAAPPPARTTAEAARHALALKRAADNRARHRPNAGRAKAPRDDAGTDPIRRDAEVREPRAGSP